VRVNLLAVLVSGVAIFVLNGLWYSPLLFAKRWVALLGKSEEELKSAGATPLMYLTVFVCGLLTAFGLAVIINHFGHLTPLRGAMIGGFCWVGLTGATSFGNALFSMKPRALWMIDSGYNLVSFVLAGIILAAWR